MEQVRKIHFARVRFGSIRNSGQLEVPDFRKKFFRSAGQIAAHDLSVIPVELNF